MPNAAGVPANFSDAITAPRIVSVNIPVTLGSINFNNYNQYTLQSSAGTNGITFNNSGEDASIGVGTGSHAINVPIVLAGNGVLDINVTPQAGVLTIGGNISEGVPGTGVLNIAAASAGTVVLSGTNTFTGGVKVAGGVLTVAGGQALASTIDVTVQQGGTFGLSAETDYQSIGSLNSHGNTVIYPNGGTLNVAANGSNAINGLVGSGVVILTATSAGVTQSLGNNGAFTGNMTINNGLIATTQGASYAFGAAGGTTTLNNVTWNGIGSTAVNFHLTGTADSFGNYGLYPTLSGNIAIDMGTTFNWSTGNGNPGALSGVLSGGGTFAVVGAASPIVNELVLTGAMANTFSGTTLVEQGSIYLQKPDGVNAIAGPLTIGYSIDPAHVVLSANEQINPSVVISFGNNVSDLRLNGFDETVGGLSSNTGNGQVGNFGTSASTLTVNAVGITTYGGSLIDGGTNSLSLTISGSGTLILAGTSSYDGDTIINSGVLIADNAAALPTGTNLTVGDPSMFAAPTVGAARVAEVASVPEPGSLVLLITSVVLFAKLYRRRPG